MGKQNTDVDDTEGGRREDIRKAVRKTNKETKTKEIDWAKVAVDAAKGRVKTGQNSYLTVKVDPVGSKKSVSVKLTKKF